jgi:hypothetical protein
VKRRSKLAMAAVAPICALALIAGTQAPREGGAGDDGLPLTAKQRSDAMRHLTEVARCARAAGVRVPDPISDEEGVHLSWEGGSRPEAEAAIARCDSDLNGR